MGTYSGAVTRAARFGVRPAPPGVAADHTRPSPEPDPFNPVPDVPPAQEATVWAAPAEFAQQSNQPNLAQVPVSHWYDGRAAVPTNVPRDVRMDAMAARMMADHSDVRYVPDGIRLYQHVSEGQANEFVVGRTSAYAGVDPGEPLKYLVMGTNAYDATNQPNEVYQGDVANVGRYRLGVKTNVWGLYQNPLGKFGQDANLRAYTGLYPEFPVDKPRRMGTAPYTPNSAGTDHWAPAQPNQVPSAFALPSETAMTDFVTAGGGGGGSDFDNRGRL